jgi:FkbM family methyltransferase
MAGLSKFKQMLRDALPLGLQVPAKFWYLKARGMLEPEIALLPFLLRSGQHAIDVGANFGSYAYAMRRMGCKVAMFEPNPQIAAALIDWAGGRDRRAAAGRWDSVHQIALSDRAGGAALHIPRDAGGIEHDASASIRAGHHGPGRMVEVETRSLDSFGFAPVDLIKIDVEGHETSVLAGARETIAASAPALIIEIEQRHCSFPLTETFSTILALGYQGWFLCENRLLPLSAFDRDTHQSAAAFAGNGQPYCNNFLFLAETRLARGEYDALFAKVKLAKAAAR